MLRKTDLVISCFLPRLAWVFFPVFLVFFLSTIAIWIRKQPWKARESNCNIYPRVCSQTSLLIYLHDLMYIPLPYILCMCARVRTRNPESARSQARECALAAPRVRTRRPESAHSFSRNSFSATHFIRHFIIIVITHTDYQQNKCLKRPDGCKIIPQPYSRTILTTNSDEWRMISLN